ncbi:MAG: hypothetical protein GQ570_01975 [Helicobacteraceae bacterium]|nr:hypothetical protein [Helicobacteraceae bacterium]
MTVRKNFLFDDEIAEQLVEISEIKHITQTQVVKELIIKEYDEVTKEEKLEAVKNFIGSGTGLFGDMTIQSIKANRDV